MSKERKWLRLPASYTPDILKSVRILAAKGLNKVQISRQIESIPVNAFHKYREVENAFQNGRSDLALRCATAFEKNLVDSYSDRVHLSKALRLFSGSYTLEPISDMSTAQNAMSASLQAFAEGNISIEELEVVRKSLATYIDSVSATRLEERLQHLEELINGKNA